MEIENNMKSQIGLVFKSEDQTQAYDKAEPRYLVMNSCSPTLTTEDSPRRMISFSKGSYDFKNETLVKGERKCANSQNIYVKHKEEEIKIPIMRKLSSSQCTSLNTYNPSRYFWSCLTGSASIVALLIFSGMFLILIFISDHMKLGLNW